MTGILLVTHGGLGDALIRGATHVLGKPLERLRALPITIADEPEAMLAAARLVIAEIEDGQGVLVISDICGGTPSNIATRLGKPGKVEAVCGASLPMLVRALTYRNNPLELVVAKALSGGSEGVIRLTGGTDRADCRG